MQKVYKALILDVDGTLIPNRKDGMPSEKVRVAVSEASKHLHVGVASGRPIFLLKHIFSHLELSGPSIINNGAQVIDIESDNVFYRKPLLWEDVLKISSVARRFDVKLLVDTDEEEIPVSEAKSYEPILGMYIPYIEMSKLERLKKEIDAIPTVATHVTPSWTDGKQVLSISNARATKQYAIWEIAKVLGIETHEIIGVGDGGNDFPLLMACGLKVAMGNATDDLKAIADYVAPSVEADGVADVIDKFVLN